MPPKIGTADVLCVEMTPEVTFGTAQGAAPDKRWAFTGNKPTPKNDYVDDNERKTGVYTIGSNSIPTKQWIEESYEFDGRLDTMAALLRMALGSLTTGAAVGGVYPHTIIESNADNDSHTWFFKDQITAGGKLDALPGMKTARVTIGGTAGGKITAKVDLIGKGAESATGTSEVTGTAPSQNTDAQLVFGNLSAFTLGGVDNKAKLKEFEFVFEVQYNREAGFGAGSIYLLHLVKTGVLLSGRIVLDFDFAAQISAVPTGTPVALVLTLTQGTSNATFTFYRAYLKDASVDGGKSVLRKPYTLDFKYSDSDGKAVQVVVNNTVAAYT